MDEQRPWHRLFELSWMDFFRGLPVTVEPEKDLALKKQLLDLLLFRKEAGPLSCRLPDGFDNQLGTYNLVSFKSYQEKLSAWTLQELLGHYVNVRKQVSPSMDEDDLLSPEEFRLFAVSARFPRNLAEDNILLTPVQQGVYEVEALSRRIRVVVINQLPLEEHNALLHLFSANSDRVTYGIQHYRVRSSESSTLLVQLFQRYQTEALTMSDALAELHRETIKQLLRDLPVEQRLEGVPVEKLLEVIPMEKLLEGVPVEMLREALAQRLKTNGPQSNPE